MTLNQIGNYNDPLGDYRLTEFIQSGAFVASAAANKSNAVIKLCGVAYNTRASSTKLRLQPYTSVTDSSVTAVTADRVPFNSY